MITVNPITQFNGTFDVPMSKPETQRAILAASLADGRSYIRGDLRCFETQLMKDACRVMRANIMQTNNTLLVDGHETIAFSGDAIECAGSALVLRIFMALAGLSSQRVTLLADTTLQKRVMAPLIQVLTQMGVEFDFIQHEARAPCRVRSAGLQGGNYRIVGDVSSQFITALLFVAPYLSKGLNLTIDNAVLSKSYIKQTLTQMKRSNISLEYDDALTNIVVKPGIYKPFITQIGVDYTSASYLFACAALFPGVSHYPHFNMHSLQGERMILDVVTALGVQISYNEQTQELTLTNNQEKLVGDYEFDVSNGPNITPTLAAIGAYVEGNFVVRGARLCQLHKSARIECMIAELTKLGVNIKPIFDQGKCDGFHIRGRSHYLGGVVFDTHHDHRLLMSLYVASLRAGTACRISGVKDSHPEASFPAFFPLLAFENQVGCVNAKF